MNLIKPSIELLPDFTPENTLQQLELCGRVCYKSEDKITSDSSKKFIMNLINRGHESVLEHANIILQVSNNIYYESMDFGPDELKFFNFSFFGEKPIINGNIRAWRDLYRKNSRDCFLNSIMKYLNFKYIYIIYKYIYFETTASSNFFFFWLGIKAQNL